MLNAIFEFPKIPFSWKWLLYPVALIFWILLLGLSLIQKLVHKARLNG